MNTGSFNQYYNKGMSVFPVNCGEKTPAMSWKSFQSQRADLGQIELWEVGGYNVGVVTGRLSNICVLDADSPEAVDYIEALGLPKTPTVKTPRGRHYYFRYPDCEVSNSVHVAGREIDVRGEGGYVVGAGSLHPSGEYYEWLVNMDDADFAPFPDVFRNNRTAKTGTSIQPYVSRAQLIEIQKESPVDRYLSSSLSEVCQELAVAVEGKRNDTLFRVAVRLASEVAGADKSWEPFAESIQRVAVSIGLGDAEARNTINSAWSSGCKSPTEWLSTAEHWAYVGVGDYFLHLPSQKPLKGKAFDTSFNSQLKSAKGSLSALLTKHDLIRKVHDTLFLPGSEEFIVERDGLRWLNTYSPSEIVGRYGDWTPFVDFLAYLVPEESERVHLAKMMAWTIRHPGRKLGHALLFRSQCQGVGKSTLVEIWRSLLGRNNTRKATTEEINGPYQGYVENSLLVVVEELNLGFGQTGYNRVKDLITGDSVSVNQKFLPVRECPNHATFVFLTNLATPVLIEDDDRRFFFIDTPSQPREQAYYREFQGWWRENLPVIRGYMDQVNLTDFDPHARPPETKAKSQLRMSSRSLIAQEIALAVQDRVGPFARDIVTVGDVRAFLGAGPQNTNAAITAAIQSLGGYQPVRQLRVAGTWKHGYFYPESGRISPWVIANHEYWRAADTSQLRHEYGSKEGRFAERDIEDLTAMLED